jgi:DNA-binding transcriptional ArsR family regulator
MTNLLWKSGTAYDLFISLMTLHQAGDFGLRPSWTAGVRQRLSAPVREFLELVFSYASAPVDWISSLPEPRDAIPVIRAAIKLAPSDRLRMLTLQWDTPAEAVQALAAIASRGSATQAEQELLGHTLIRRQKHFKPAELENLLKIWTDMGRSCLLIIQALQEYQQAFFEDEETRIRPVLLAGLENARELAGRVTVQNLLENLSRGVHLEKASSAKEITLVPSYWSTPFIFATTPQKGRMQVVFGCRSEVQSIAPGAETPDRLMNALKSLADPTRLRILRYLSGQLQTPTDLSRRLRLRLPTVLHHLQALRLAELVTIRLSENGEKRYTTRTETLKLIFTSVEEFLKKQD